MAMSSRHILLRSQAFKLAVGPLERFGHFKRHDFHTTCIRQAVKPFLLSDPGEGIKEVQIIQWFVQPGARVGEFDKICEIASDKAVTEITSRYEGVIKKIHFEPDDFVQVGQALLDIDVQNGDVEEAEDLPKETSKHVVAEEVLDRPTELQNKDSVPGTEETVAQSNVTRAPLATPAVRGLLKQHDIDISHVKGTGTDGRVLKDDVQKYLNERDEIALDRTSAASTTRSVQTEVAKALSPVQTQMLKTMTRSLSIPHFLYTDEIDLTALSTLRQKLNSTRPPESPKLTSLAFIIKALAFTLTEFPLLNARLDPGSETSRPQLFMRSHINIGVAMDTPSGLLVPTIKNVADLSVDSIASELSRLQKLGKGNNFAPADLKSGTITVSNIGSIGGTYVSPLIVEGEVAILGVGREKVVPGFDEAEKIVKKRVCAFSWSADHRVLDGAYVARAAERMRVLLEEPGEMVRVMR